MKSLTLPEVKSLLHYFGFEYLSKSAKQWVFVHKSIKGCFCFVTANPIVVSDCIGFVEFRHGENMHKTARFVTIQVYSWTEVFMVVRSHVRYMLGMRSGKKISNQKQAA